MTLSRSLQCRAFSRVVMDENLLSPLFPIGGGGGRWAVVANDWCIINILSGHLKISVSYILCVRSERVIAQCLAHLVCGARGHRFNPCDRREKICCLNIING